MVEISVFDLPSVVVSSGAENEKEWRVGFKVIAIKLKL